MCSKLHRKCEPHRRPRVGHPQKTGARGPPKAALRGASPRSARPCLDTQKLPINRKTPDIIYTWRALVAVPADARDSQRRVSHAPQGAPASLQMVSGPLAAILPQVNRQPVDILYILQSRTYSRVDMYNTH